MTERFQADQDLARIQNPFEQSPTPIDVVRSVARLQSGDTNGAVEIYTHYAPRLFRFFSRRFPEIAEDLVQNTLMLVLSKAGEFRFEPKPNKKNDMSSAFGKWVFNIGRNEIFSELRERDKFKDIESVDEKNEKGKQYPEPAREERQVDQIDVTELNRKLDQRLNELLKPYELRVVNAARSGQSIPEIVVSLGLPEASVSTILSKARTRIERELLTPAGFKRLREYYDGQSEGVKVGIYNAAKLYGLVVVDFLNMKYTTDEWMERYRHTKGHKVDNAVIGSGYVLTDELTVQEFRAIHRRANINLIRRHKGRHYIKQSDLDEIRTGLETKPIRELADGYVYTTNIAATIREYRIITTAIRQRKISGKQVDGEWCVLPGELSKLKLNK